MVWYVALVAIANVGLGYALAVYLRRAMPRRRTADFNSESSAVANGEYGADDAYYEQPAYENELESAVS